MVGDGFDFALEDSGAVGGNHEDVRGISVGNDVQKGFFVIGIAREFRNPDFGIPVPLVFGFEFLDDVLVSGDVVSNDPDAKLLRSFGNVFFFAGQYREQHPHAEQNERYDDEEDDLSLGHGNSGTEE